MNKIYLAAFLVLAIAFPALAVSTTTVTTTTVTTYEGVSDEAAQVTPESSEPLPPALTPVTYNGTTKSGQALYLDAGLGMGYYYLYPKDSQLQAFYKGGLNWRAFMEFKSDSGLSAAGEFGIFSEGNMSSLAPAGTALTIIPVTASIAYHFFKDSSIQPYLGGGVGIYFINESDPDYTYLSATKFGTHLMAGADVFFTPETFMRAEIRDTFIDHVNSTYYYDANFGGLSASVSLGIEIPIKGKEANMSSDERALYKEETRYESNADENAARLNQMIVIYNQPTWDDWTYRQWRSRRYLYSQINYTRRQMEVDRQQADQIRGQRQQYIQQKSQLRNQKEQQSNPSGDNNRQQYIDQKNQLKR